MEDLSLDISSIERDMESLILASKSYVNRRAEEEILYMRSNIYSLNQKLDKAIQRSKESEDSRNRAVLKSLKKITAKLQATIPLLEEIKNYKPCYRELDIPSMVDILLDDIKSLIYYNEKWTSMDRLESDLRTIELLEEQHKRVLLTFLMQDWDNLKEVLNLMKVGEIYKNIAEELVHVFLLINTLEEQS